MAAAKHVLVIHGPNMDLLGQRQPTLYGPKTLTDIDSNLKRLAEEYGFVLAIFQSNSESALIEQVHQAKKNGTAFIVINPAALTHTSVALRDALLSTAIPFIEVHITNIYAREQFRHQSYFSEISKGVISGLGPQGYELAMAAVNQYLNKPTSE